MCVGLPPVTAFETDAETSPPVTDAETPPPSARFGSPEQFTRHISDPSQLAPLRPLRGWLLFIY